ncbi:MAG: outer membrane beta-barrel protein, partial [Bacteroidales bacterium]
DLSIISPDNIEKIIHYATPPIQYQNLGLGSIINIITKRKVRGGTIALNAQNALTSGFGNNTAGFRYNFGNSQLGVKYNINYTDNNDVFVDESLEYNIDSKTIKKDKIGIKSPSGFTKHYVEIDYAHSNPDDHIFSSKLYFDCLDYTQTIKQNVQSNFGELPVINFVGKTYDKNQYYNPAIDLYYNKKVAEKHDITINTVGTWYRTSYDYSYSETAGNITEFETNTDILTDKYSIIADAFYSYTFKKQKFFAGTRYKWEHSTQLNIPKTKSLSSSDIYPYIGMNGMLWKRLNYSLSLGMNVNIFNLTDGSTFNHFNFRPSVKIGYFISELMDISLNYEVNTRIPTISMLTYNPYYKDHNYIFIGNSSIKPYNEHTVALSWFRGSKIFAVGIDATYIHANDAFVPVFIKDNGILMKTYANIDRSRTAKGSFLLSLNPFRKRILTLKIFGEVSYIANDYLDHSWNYFTYVIIPTATISISKWSINLFYQTKRDNLDGHILTQKSGMAYAELSYRPVKSLNITAGWRYPIFYKGNITVEESFGTDLIHYRNSNLVKDFSNMVYLTLTYNFSFGDKRDVPIRKLNNKDTDSGILNRK